MGSVLQAWVEKLPLRAQGTLLTCVRGCDLTPKLPLNSSERRIVGWLRWTFMNPADAREIGIPGAFYQSVAPDFKPSEWGHYPLHWFSHVMHSLEVVGRYHPDSEIAATALYLYDKMARSLHLHPESAGDLVGRLTEDRIATDTVVS